MAIESGTCARCGDRFPSYRERVPGVRPGTTKWGSARKLCGVCDPISKGVDWAVAAVGRRAAEVDPDELAQHEASA